MERSKPMIGLCGGIGAGKSAVAAEFARQGCLVIDSDKLNHVILKRPDVVQTLHAWWGDDVVVQGVVDRGGLARRVFADAAARRRLERLVFPLIARLREDTIKAHLGDSTVRAFVLDSPLLFESQLDRRCDAVVFVDASDVTRLERVRQRRGWDEATLRQREQAQLPLSDKRARSQFVVTNDGALADLVPQVEAILSQLVKRKP